MKKTMTILITIIFLLVYLVGVRFIANNKLITYTNGEKIGGGHSVRMDFGASAEITVTKRRWYGTIVENSNERGRVSNIYLLKFIELPIRVNSFNIVPIHLTFLLICSIFFFITTERRSRKNEGYFQSGINSG